MRAFTEKEREVLISRRQVLSGLATVTGATAWSPFLQSVVRAEDTPAVDKFDAIVVGAGAIGCNTAWHLRKRGLRVLVLEAQAGAASQSTNGAAGFVAAWSAIHVGNWGKTEWEMQRYGIDFYTQLAKRTSDDIGFVPAGIAYVYASASGWKGMQPKIEQARKFGTTVEILNAARAKEVTPFLEFDQVAGIAFDPDAIRVRAGDAIRALAKELASDGTTVEYNVPVTGFLRRGDRVIGVKAGDREILAGHVFITAGAWSRPLLALLELACPAVPKNETRYVTKPLAGLKPGMPLLIFADRHGHYIREEQGGLLIGGGDKRPLPSDRVVDPNHPPLCGQLPQDQADRVREMIRETETIMPSLKDAEVSEIRSGMPTFTRDTLFIAGPVPDIAGLYVMSGCQEAGVTHGPALGRILCEYAIDGKTFWDSSRFLPSRSLRAS